MTIRFSPAFGGASPAIARTLCGSAPLNGANDNAVRHAAMPRKPDASPVPLALIDPQVERALRHFADHGLAAARIARERAEAARRDGDEARSDHWIDICRQLDRRAARGFARA
ncbi:hypothetical protein [Novosphingobium sp. 9]|uniref:hypothetical protein n=1 Tax=Novosphingobium sp. 9 TaxID=2025349 RepID=UPI0021B64A99|nr:hypothetical protein [Novosphingobium sp. 9]